MTKKALLIKNLSDGYVSEESGEFLPLNDIKKMGGNENIETAIQKAEIIAEKTSKKVKIQTDENSTLLWGAVAVLVIIALVMIFRKMNENENYEEDEFDEYETVS